MPARYTGAPSVPIARASRPGSLTPTSVWLPTTITGFFAARSASAAALDRASSPRRLRQLHRQVELAAAPARGTAGRGGP